MEEKRELKAEELGKVIGGVSDLSGEIPYIPDTPEWVICDVCGTVFDATTVEKNVEILEQSETSCSGILTFRCPTCGQFRTVTRKS